MSVRPKVLTSAQARAIDEDARERLGMPTALLMENAARSVADVARSLGDRFVLLCGAGNNGGDGLAAARHLGVARCAIYLLSEPDPGRAPDAALQRAILANAGVQVCVGTPPDVASHVGAVWIDAMFGTGLSRELVGAARVWVDAFNAADGSKLSVDIPSGIHGDTGAVMGAACRADVTVTFVAPKIGMTIGQGPAHAGDVRCADIGLPSREP